MFCPHCSAHNLDEAKFCRVCGTNLELVSLALSNHLPPVLISPSNEQVKKRRSGKGNVIQGAILLGSSLFILLLGMLLSRGHFPWLFFWTLFFGWMACWGTVSLAIGVGRMIDTQGGGIQKPPEIGSGGISSTPTFPTSSVVDHTTRHLRRNN